MKKYGFYFLLCLVLIVSGCNKVSQNEIDETNADAYAVARLFCDVSFWQAPAWNTTPGTITGDISAATGLALEFDVPSVNADTQLSFHLINNDLPDIISLTDTASIRKLANSGKVWEIDEFLRRYRPDSHILVDFPEDAKKTLIERDGAWYAYPSHLDSMDARATWKGITAFYDDTADYRSNYAIIWNKSMLETLGLSVEELQTEEQVLSAFKTAKGRLVNGREIIPLLLDGTDYFTSTQYFLLSTFGAEYVNNEGNYRHVILQPEARQALYFVNQCLRNGYADPEQLMYENVKIKEYIASGRVLCFIGNIANTDMRPSEWVSSGVILSSKGDSPVFGRNMGAVPNWIGWIHTFISKDCRNPEEIAAWLDYVTSEEGLTLWYFGYEGIHFNYDGDGLIVVTPEWRAAINDYSQTGIGSLWMVDNTAWKYSKQPPPKPGSGGMFMAEISIAFGSHPKTRSYDSSLLYFPGENLLPDSEYGIIEKNIMDWQKKQIPVLIMSENDVEFEAQYQIFMSNFETLGINKLDEKINEFYQINCINSGRVIERVNGANDD